MTKQWRAWCRRERLDREMHGEVPFHLDMETDKYVETSNRVAAR